MKVLNKLAYSYFNSHKKSYLSISFGILLSTFLMMSFFIAKDSYHDWQVRITEYMNGRWEVVFEIDEETKPWLTELQDHVYVKQLPLSYEKEAFSSVRSVSEYNDLLGFHLLKGNYPMKSSQVLVDSEFAKKEQKGIGDSIVFTTEKGKEKQYIISGIFDRSITQQNTVFYVHGDSHGDEGMVYGTLHNASRINDFREHVKGVRINEEVVNMKYHTSRMMELITLCGMFFIAICSILFLYNTYYIQVVNKKAYFKQLQLLGASKAQVGLLIFIDLVVFGGVIFLVSAIISYGVWAVLIKLSRALLMHLFEADVMIGCVLKTASVYNILCLMAVTFILSGSLVFIKLFRHKQTKLYFRNLTLTKLSIESRIGLLDMLRRKKGFSIMISVFVSVCIFLCTQYPLQVFLDAKKESFTVYKHEIEANFAFYHLTGKTYEQFIDEAENFRQHKVNRSCQYSFTLAANVQVDDELQTGTLLVSDDAAFSAFLERNKLKNQKGPILLNRFYVQTEEGKTAVEQVAKTEVRMHVDLLDIGGEPYATYEDKAIVVNDDITPFREQTDSMVFLCPASYIRNILHRYPGGGIAGTFEVDTNHPTKVESILQESFHKKGNDYVYVNNLAQRAESYYSYEKVLHILVFGFVGMILLLCLCNIGNILYQYYDDRKQDKFLLRVVGMSEKQWRKQVYMQLALYGVIGLFSAYVVSISVNYMLYKKVLSMLTESFHISVVPMILSAVISALLLFGFGFFYGHKQNDEIKRG